MNMNINVLGENLFVPYYGSANSTTKMFSNVSSPEVDTCSVKVTISEEGKKACKNNIEDSEKTNYEFMVANRTELIDQKNVPEIHYGFMLGNKLAEIIEHDEEFRSIEEKGSLLLEAYASTYDEIMQGHVNGTRSNYVEDQTAEHGYRKMTMEEEISGLDVAYQKYVSGFEAQTQQIVDASEAFDKYMAKLSILDVHRAKMAAKAKEVFSKMSEDDIPENIADSMLGAKQKFIELYSRNDYRSMNIRSLLKDIRIFL